MVFMDFYLSYETAPCRALTLVVDTLVSCLTRFIHTLAHIIDNFLNAISAMRFTELNVLRLERETVSRRSKEFIIFCRQISLMLSLTQFEGTARLHNMFQYMISLVCPGKYSMLLKNMWSFRRHLSLCRKL